MAKDTKKKPAKKTASTRSQRSSRELTPEALDKVVGGLSIVGGGIGGRAFDDDDLILGPTRPTGPLPP